MSLFLQFGTSRFLQAHADLFISESLGSNQICLVQSSGNTSTSKRLEALSAPEGYPVEIKGIENGIIVERTAQIMSIEKSLSTADNWAGVEKEFLDSKFVISNVSEKGYIPHESDEKANFDNRNSYPAKLFRLLTYRFQQGAEPLTLMPLELFESNGNRLKRLILEMAAKQTEDAYFISWLHDCIWVNSLVDRIVAEPIEPAGAIAEPYALWAVEATEGLDFPFSHPSVKLVSNLDKYQLLKLYILNLSHSYMAQKWVSDDMPRDMVVREYMSDNVLVEDLCEFASEEVLPGFEAANLGEEARGYFETTLDRFRNPFLNHHFTDIVDGHHQKIVSRAGGFLKWAKSNNDFGQKPRLENLLTVSRDGT